MSDQQLPPPRANSNPQRMHSLSPVNSISQSPTIRMPPDNRAYFDGQQQRNGNGNGNVNGMIVDNGRKRARTQSTGDHAHERVSPTPGRDVKVEGLPSVLVREKKQKACANCRRAKLKCIVEGNETDCVRCRARKERCIFYPRGHVSGYARCVADSRTKTGSRLSPPTYTPQSTTSQSFRQPCIT